MHLIISKGFLYNNEHHKVNTQMMEQKEVVMMSKTKKASIQNP